MWRCVCRLAGCSRGILFLKGCLRGLREGIDAGQPFNASVDGRLGQTIYVFKAVDEHTALQCSQTPQLGVAMNFGHWLPIHFSSQHEFVDRELSPWYGDALCSKGQQGGLIDAVLSNPSPILGTAVTVCREMVWRSCREACGAPPRLAIFNALSQTSSVFAS
jgi:hypothetical protein